MIDTDCTTCDGHGTLGRTPDGERIYCRDCAYGVGLHIEVVSQRMDNAGVWLRDMGYVRKHDPVCFKAVKEYLEAETALFDELSALLDTLKQDETNRPRALLFEDL